MLSSQPFGSTQAAPTLKVSTLNCLMSGSLSRILLQQLHVDVEAVGMLAQRRVEQEDGVLGERLGLLDLQVGPEAGVEVERAVLALPAADGLHLRVRRREGEDDVAARCLRRVQVVRERQPAAALLLLRVLRAGRSASLHSAALALRVNCSSVSLQSGSGKR